jgi:uncharacterized protein
MRRLATIAIIGGLLVAGAMPCLAQQRALDSAGIAHRIQMEKELESIAVIDRKEMISMRDGVRLATDVYRPKDATGPVPAIFVRTPDDGNYTLGRYNYTWWDVRNGVPNDMSAILTIVKRGYAYVEETERGRYYSEGNWDILGPPLTDGYDAIKWISTRPWSNGKVGLIGCSSTAEWQLAVASTAPPGLAAMNPQGFGAGIGRVKPYYEMGNWYRGGAVQMLFIDWLYGEQNQVRPMFPPNTTQQDLVEVSHYFDLNPQLPRVDWGTGLWHLPIQDILRAVDGPRGIFADSMPVPTGGRMIQRTPNDPAWYKGGLYHDDMVIDVPGLYFMSWYDVSQGPNLALYNHVRATASPAVGRQQYAVIAPVGHCAYKRASESTIVGERNVGDARLDYDALTFAWFDHFLKGEDNHLLDSLPRVRYYTMGMNKWQSSDTWPPRGAGPVSFFLSSDGKANTIGGDGKLAMNPAARDLADTFTYDPMNPVPTHGGNVCCNGPSVTPGSLDQQKMEARPDVLVYTTDALKEGMEVSGPVEVTLYVSSDRKDTDFTVKLIDVYPDGRAYNIDESIQRMRYREGYEKPPVWMESGKVYKVAVGPLNTSNYFEAGHRIRIEVSSSNFPRFDRNLNTGGHNYDETEGLVAHNSVHHSKQYPSVVTLTVVNGRPA